MSSRSPQPPRYLLGATNDISRAVDRSSGGRPKEMPYTLGEARRYLLPMANAVAARVTELPAPAWPRDEAVVAVTLHPQLIAKTYFPSGLFDAVGLRAVGSRARRIVPKQWTRKEAVHEVTTTEFFVAGKRSGFEELSRLLQSLPSGRDAAVEQLDRGLRDITTDLLKIEDIRFLPPEDRTRPPSGDDDRVLLEVVLLAGDEAGLWVFDAFVDYAQQFDAAVDVGRRLTARGLDFVPVIARRRSIEDLARFSFLRIARGMPRLRSFRPATRGLGSAFAVSPEAGPVADPATKVAILDGGVPPLTGPLAFLAPYITPREPAGVCAATSASMAHGLGVASAFLFGPLSKGNNPGRPPAGVDVWRVVDRRPPDPLDPLLYDVLLRIKAILSEHDYDFVNISLGPEETVEDDRVSPWASMLDELAAQRGFVLTVAPGNNGELDAAAGLNRVMIPSDSVHAVAVGAADSDGVAWSRATYSPVGPGRSPGVVKPDCIAFGGSDEEPYYVFSPGGSGTVEGVCGTSFASPTALRAAALSRALFGPQLGGVAARALLTHRCEPHGELPLDECGTGRVPSRLGDLVTCDDGEVHILYRGELEPGQAVRLTLPVVKELQGKVTIQATFVQACEVDPSHSSAYTRGGLTVTFRPRDDRFREIKPGESPPPHAVSRRFFGPAGPFAGEAELREDAGRWEAIMSSKDTMLPKSLRNPVFDVVYLAREGAHAAERPSSVRYAMMLTVRAPKVPDLYNRTVVQFKTIVQPLVPRLELRLG